MDPILLLGSDFCTIAVVPPQHLAIALSVCSDLGEHKDVYVSVNPPTLTITNSNSEPIYYFVVGQNESALIDWIPSCDETIRIQEGKQRAWSTSVNWLPGNQT